MTNYPRTAAAAAICLATILCAGNPSTVEAQQSRIMPLAQVKSILNTTRTSWLAFREYGGRQLVYFTQIISWHCGIAQIRYSTNGVELNERFPVPKCNPLLPNNIGTDDKIYLQFPPASVKTVAVQIIYDDESASDIHIFGPCPGAGGATCAQLVETRDGAGVIRAGTGKIQGASGSDADSAVGQDLDAEGLGGAGARESND